MADNIPDNVDLAWTARDIVGLREELHANTRNLQMLRDDVDIMAAILRRVDNNQTAYREELRTLYELHRDLRIRVEAIEAPHER